MTGDPNGGVPDARHQITEQLGHLAEALDTRNRVRLAALFTPDATAYGRTGVDDIVAVVRQHLGGCGPPSTCSATTV